MDLPERHQANDFLPEAPPPDPSIPHQYNHVPQNAWVSFRYWNFYAGAHPSTCIPLQVQPAPAHGQPEAHHENLPPPVRDVAGPGRVQDPHHYDMAYQGVVDYRPQPFAVSISILLLSSLLVLDDIRAIEP
jgi:hypothetical protein